MIVKNIILDPGHGGVDLKGNYTTAPGKMFTFPDGTTAYEGVINREITNYILKCLKPHTEYNVVLTVDIEDPTDVSLVDRVAKANKLNSKETIFISIHCNSGGGKGTGFEIFTTTGVTKSDKLAEFIANSVEHVYNKVGLKLRYDFSDGDKDKESNFYVLRKTKCPSVLLECGFFDNKKDFNLLSDTQFKSEIASFIYTGILNFISNESN